jgi:hypothetical protein
MSFKDVQRIVWEESDRRQRGLVLVQSSQAYVFFHKGKSPYDVSVELNMREKEVTELYGEYLRLNNHHELCKIYRETNGNLNPLLTFIRMIEKSGMSNQDGVRAIRITNNDLGTVEQRYKSLQNQVFNLETRKQSLEQQNDNLRGEFSIIVQPSNNRDRIYKSSTSRPGTKRPW